MKQYTVIFLTISISILSSCSRLVEIGDPVNSITTNGAFSTDATATSAIVGIYSKMINNSGQLSFANGGTTLNLGLSSDELTKVGLPNSSPLSEFYTNSLLPENGLWFQLWEPAYFMIYQANSALEALNQSNTIAPSVSQQLTGECKFLRAFSLFYLTNLWGDIPMPLTSDWNQTHLLSRTTQEQVYQQIVRDLSDAQDLLGNDYSASNFERIRANTYAATALLARVYLFLNDWPNAEQEASKVISNNDLFALGELQNTFLKNSNEAILQLQPSNRSYPFTVTEANLIPEYPFYYLSEAMVNAFESADDRLNSWTRNVFLDGMTVTQPNKYKVDFIEPGGTVTEYYMILRLAEQYLIRSEARAHQDKISGAQDDLNTIRFRAGLPETSANDKSSLLLAIEHERRVELFAEWGHRWLDLIRTNRADVVLQAEKRENWQTTDKLYPIPQAEIQKNPNLNQNKGY